MEPYLNCLFSHTLITGLSCGSSFNRGIHRIVFQAEDATGAKTKCSFQFEVKVYVCNALSRPKNGNKDCDGTEMIWGSSCRFSCIGGYDLQGSPILTCQQNGNYGDNVPTCKAKLCPALDTPENGNPYDCSSGLQYRSVCKASCKYGYDVKLNIDTSCTETGTWRQPLPECEDVLPPVFDDCPLNKIVKYADPGLTSTTVTYGLISAIDRPNGDKLNTKLVIGPPSGSVLVSGIYIVKYIANDATGNTASCEFVITVQVLTCPVQDNHGDYLDITCPEGRRLGSQCSYSCRLGSKLNGTKNAICVQTDSEPPQTFWNYGADGSPHCMTQPCGKLHAPNNGALPCADLDVGSVCTVQCESGFDIPRSIQPAQQYFCSTSGQWIPNSDVPDCTEMRCPNRMRLPIEFYYDGECGTDLSKDQIKKNFIDHLDAAGICKATDPSKCTVNNVEVTCGNRIKRGAVSRIDKNNFSHNLIKRETALMILTLDIEIQFYTNGETLVDSRASHKAKLEAIGAKIKTDASSGLLNSLVEGFILRNNSVQYGDANFVCPPGQLADYVSVSCRGCPTGMMYTNYTKNGCTNCPKGSYQDEDFSLSCKSCPLGSSTIKEGSRHSNFCLSMCQVGESSPTGLEPCSPCPVGSYQDINGSKSCKQCPMEEYSVSGSTQVTDCEGFDWVLSGPTTLVSKPVVSETDFSITSWFKHDRRSSKATTITLEQNDNLFDISLFASLSISVYGITVISNVTLTDHWNHLAVTWNQSSKELRLYIGGHFRESINVGSALPILLSEDSKLRISVPEAHYLHIRSVELVRGVLSDVNISALAMSCEVTDTQTILSRKDLISRNESTISLAVPSSCDAIDDCVSSPCGNHTCIDQPNGFKCQCSAGYTGKTCNIPPDYCKTHDCQNEATCTSVPEITSYTCTCAVGYKGQLCDVQIVNGNWGNWTDWGECSVTCGGGSQQKKRFCDNPSPDEDGKQCSGSDNEVKSCNNQKCPECNAVDLRRVFGTRISCNGNQSSLSCEVKCQKGKFYNGVEPRFHNCTNGIWVPGTTVQPCTRIYSSYLLQLSVKLSYDTIDCSDKIEVGELKKQYSNNLRQETCAGNQLCDDETEVNECSGTRKRRQTGTTLTSTLSVDLSEADLNLEAYEYNKTISPQLKKLIDAIEVLEQAGFTLQNETDKFFVSVNGITHLVSSVTVEGKTDCPPGSIGDSGMCVECPAGMFSNGSTCTYCKQGYYQYQPGQVVCLACSSGWTTEFIGSMDSALCSIPANGFQTPESSSTMTPMQISGSLTTHSVSARMNETDRIFVTVSSVIGSLALVVILAIITCFIHSRMRKPRLCQIFTAPQTSLQTELEDMAFSGKLKASLR